MTERTMTEELREDGTAFGEAVADRLDELETDKADLLAKKNEAQEALDHYWPRCEKLEGLLFDAAWALREYVGVYGQTGAKILSAIEAELGQRSQAQGPVMTPKDLELVKGVIARLERQMMAQRCMPFDGAGKWDNQLQDEAHAIRKLLEERE